MFLHQRVGVDYGAAREVDRDVPAQQIGLNCEDGQLLEHAGHAIVIECMPAIWSGVSNNCVKWDAFLIGLPREPGCQRPLAAGTELSVRKDMNPVAGEQIAHISSSDLTASISTVTSASDQD
jgi:hypothetical protein